MQMAEAAAFDLGGVQEQNRFQDLVRFSQLTARERTEEELRAKLSSARELAGALSDENNYPAGYQQRNNSLCLQREVLRFYDRLGDDALFYQDRFARAELAFRHCLFELPDGVAEWRGCNSVIGRALLDYRAVFSAARTMHKDPLSYVSYHQAKRLGMNIQQPTPELSNLQSFIDFGVQASLQDCRLGGSIGAALGPTLCDAMELYPPETRNQLAGVYMRLIRYDGGTLARSSHIHLFLQELEKELGAAPVGWDAPGGLCQFQDTPAPELSFERRVSQPVPQADELAEILGSLRRKLDRGLTVGAEGECQTSASNVYALRVVLAYSRFLFATAEALDLSQAAREHQKILAEESVDVLLTGIELPRLGVASTTLEEARNTLTTQLVERGNRLLEIYDLDSLINFGTWSLQRGGETLTPLQERTLHAFLAKAYYLKGDDTEAVGHALESNITLDDLENMRKEFQKYGVGVPR